MVTQDRIDLTAQLAEYNLATRRFPVFLDFCYVGDPPPNGDGIVKFQKWPHLLEVCDLLSQHQFLVWLKSRQIGASWIVAAYALWTASYKPGANVLMLSQGEDESKDLLRKTKQIYDWLPPELQTPMPTPGSTQRLDFNNGSNIRALPSTPRPAAHSPAPW